MDAVRVAAVYPESRRRGVRCRLEIDPHRERRQRIRRGAEHPIVVGGAIGAHVERLDAVPRYLGEVADTIINPSPLEGEG